VTSLCLTRNRRQWLPRAIQCFLDQTFPSRELLILADGDDVRDLVPPDERIRLLVLEGKPEIGEKRNFGCSRARGEVVAHWDDDDWSAPGRLLDQIERLEASGKAVTGYHTIKFTDGKRWWLYPGVPHYATGTSLCYRKSWWAAHEFPFLQIGEDNNFVSDAGVEKQLASADGREMIAASLHAGNTSRHSMAGYQLLKAEGV
jgi:glycosyltransferase involved in cell wall biosynthesis